MGTHADRCSGVRDRLRIEDRFGLSFWDALIVASAQSAGCDSLLTEDLQHDMDFDGVRVIDPFKVPPAEHFR